MKTNLTSWSLALVSVALLAAAQAADNWIRYSQKPGSVVLIEGDSTIHKWKTKGVIISGAFEVEPEFRTDLSLKSVKSLMTKEVNPRVQASIPIRSLKSQSSVGASKMDEIMQEAMRAKENPTITYRLSEMVVKGTVPDSGTPVKFDTKGELAVSGVTNACAMEVTMERLPDDKLKFTATTPLKMTDFKIKPPAPSLLGMAPIKTDDNVTIKIEWILGPATDAPAAPAAPAAK